MLIDISMPIKNGSVFRLGTPPIEISTRTFHHALEGEYQTAMLTLPAHAATHIDLAWPGIHIDLERMFGVGRLIDVTNQTDGCISVSDYDDWAEVREGDFVFFRTGWSKFADTEKYYRHPELGGDVIRWLISRKVGAVGIDALGLGRDSKHGEYDRMLAQSNILVIENLANLAAIPTSTFSVFCLPLSIENVDATPARIIVATG